VTHVTCRLTAKNWDQLGNPTLVIEFGLSLLFSPDRPLPSLQVRSSEVLVAHSYYICTSYSVDMCLFNFKILCFFVFVFVLFDIIVFSLVSPVLSQEIGWEERL